MNKLKNKNFNYIIDYIIDYYDENNTSSDKIYDELIEHLKDEIKTLQIKELEQIIEIIIENDIDYALEPIIESLDDVFIKKNRQEIIRFLQKQPKTKEIASFLNKLNNNKHKKIK